MNKDHPAATSRKAVAAAAALSLSCDEVQQEASPLTTYLHYVKLNIGTTNDSTPYVDEIDGVIAVLRNAIEPCFPTDAAEVAGLARTTDALRQSWVTGADQSAQDTDTDGPIDDWKRHGSLLA